MRFFEKTLYHGTAKENVVAIFEDGLKPNGFGIVYMSPGPELARNFGECVLRVNVTGYDLSAFEDCAEWERFCWTKEPIPPDRIEIEGGYGYGYSK